MHRIVSARHPGIESRPSSDGELNQLPPRHQQLAERQINEAECLNLVRRSSIGIREVAERELTERWVQTFGHLGGRHGRSRRND